MIVQLMDYVFLLTLISELKSYKLICQPTAFLPDLHQPKLAVEHHINVINFTNQVIIQQNANELNGHPVATNIMNISITYSHYLSWSIEILQVSKK